MKKAFKMACLAYEPSAVTYEDAAVSRSELLGRRARILKRQKNMLNALDRTGKEIVSEGTMDAASDGGRQDSAEQRVNRQARIRVHSKQPDTKLVSRLEKAFQSPNQVSKTLERANFMAD